MNIPTPIKRLGFKALTNVKHYSPEILVGAGIVGFVAAGVMAARATLKLEDTLFDAKSRKELVELSYEKHEDKKQRAKDLTYIHLQTTKDLAKLYWGPTTIALASGAAILTAHGIMRKRNATLVAAYSLLERSFSDYRDRVIQRLGEDEERDIRLGIKTEEIVDPETGKKKKVKSFNPNDMSIYARVFDESNIHWEDAPNYNQTFVVLQQQIANNQLASQGFLFLNDVYEMLGFDKTEYGQIVGWIFEDGVGDDHVDFGIFEADDQMKRDFVNGYNKAIWLDFNVQGEIIGKFTKFTNTGR